MDMAITPFLATRARNTDPQTSHDAAKHAISSQSANQRIVIRRALERVAPFGLTTKEIAQETGIPYESVKKRVSETGLVRTTDRREGNAIWTAPLPFNFLRNQAA